jgi:hypothetical protein
LLGLKAQYVWYVEHYLDDFITVGSPESHEWSYNCSMIDSTLEKLFGHKDESAVNPIHPLKG